MTAPTNLGFETPGAAPGEADGWTLTAVATAEEIAGFGSPEAPVERFEDWVTAYLDHFEPGDVEVALYDSVTVFSLAREGFEVLWDGNELYLTELGLTESASFDTAGGPANIERFESEWSNSSYLTAFDSGDIAALPSGVERFESAWNNSSYLTAFGGGDLIAAEYDAALDSREDFEDEWTLTMTTM
jgi:hypothetical protein